MNELREKLWDLVYGLLDEPEAAALRQRITSDRDVAREYARVKLQSELVANAARAAQEERDLATLSEETGLVMRAYGSRPIGAARLVAIVGSLALSIGMLVYAGSEYWSQESPLRGDGFAQALETFAEKNPRLLVTGPPELSIGAANPYRVKVERANDGTPLSLPVEANLLDSHGATVWRESGMTSANGELSFQLPQDFDTDGAYFFNVAAGDQSAQGVVDSSKQPQFSTWLPVNGRQRSEPVVVQHVSGATDTFEWRVELSDDQSRPALDGARTASESKGLKASGDESADRPIDRKLAMGEPGKKKLSKANVDTQRDGVLTLPGQSGQSNEEALPPLQQRYAEYPPRAGAKDLPREPKLPKIVVRAPASGSGGVEPRSETANAPIRAVTTPAPAEAKPMSSGRQSSPPSPVVELAPEDTVATVNPKPSSPRKDPQMGIEVTKDGEKGEKEIDEVVSVSVDAAEKSEPADKELLEQISVNGEIAESRLRRTPASNELLLARIEELREHGQIDRATTGKIEAVLYDPSYAPPQRVAEASVEIPPATQPLNLSVTLDRSWYRAGEPVGVEFRVTDEQGAPLPAVLNVQLDAVSPDEADQPWTPPPLEVSYVSTGDSPVPLVFGFCDTPSVAVRISVCRGFISLYLRKR